MQNQEAKSHGSEELTERKPKSLPLVIWPDPILRQAAKEVQVFDEGLLELVEDMIFTMQKNSGAGLAAPQVNDPRQIIVYNEFRELPSAALINPKIIESTTSTVEDWEGCLSFPGVTVKVKRSDLVRVNFQDIYGTEHTQDFKGFIARVIQHEIEHLQGITFTRYLSGIKRDLVDRKMKKLKKKRARKNDRAEEIKRRISSKSAPR